MSSNTLDALIDQIKAHDETIRAYVAQMLSGEYGPDGTADEPIDEDETPISEYPLEVVDERGREFAVVLATGGPHVEVVADGGSSARLVGYWGGLSYTLHGDRLDTFLDYFIDRD